MKAVQNNALDVAQHVHHGQVAVLQLILSNAYLATKFPNWFHLPLIQIFIAGCPQNYILSNKIIFICCVNDVF